MRMFAVQHRKSANQWRDLYLAAGYLVRVRCFDSQLLVCIWYPTGTNARDSGW